MTMTTTTMPDNGSFRYRMKGWLTQHPFTQTNILGGLATNGQPHPPPFGVKPKTGVRLAARIRTSTRTPHRTAPNPITTQELHFTRYKRRPAATELSVVYEATMGGTIAKYRHR
jgi:hypothetical protein